MTTTQVKIKLLDPKCLPVRRTKGAAGYDLVAREPRFIYKHQTILVPVGFALELPEGMEVQIRGRSSLNLKGILVRFGTVDADYRGEVQVIMRNTSLSIGFEVKPGDCIAQMVIAHVAKTELVEVPELSDTDRGGGGFGSTDVKPPGIESSASSAVLDAKMATDEEIRQLPGPSYQDTLLADRQRQSALDWQRAHDPFAHAFDLNNGTDS